MEQKNLDYLQNQLKMTGFGEGMENLLKSQMEQGRPEFTISRKLEFDSDKLDATLHFGKSKETDKYFFNRYELALQKAGNAEDIKQSFLVSPKHTTFTLKEAYNLMSGRAVNKDMSALQKVSEGDKVSYKPTGNKYNAWVQLDFNDADKYGNYKLKVFSGNDKLDLEKALSKHPVKEMQAEPKRTYLLESLRRGNRQSVTYTKNGSEQKAFVQADPKNKAVRLYDENGRELKQTEKRQANEKKGKDKSLNASVRQEDEGRRKGMKVS